ncbi:MAG: hypothetical protein EB068_00030 [Betaproteobacteria bacterium]|nr:hypothetical protein [Betaproteobacteria bacterium]
MAVINTNTKALFSQQALKASGLEQTKAMEQLSTGKRINHAGDDAAGLAIATRMTQQIRALNQAVRNAGDAISLIQTAEGATTQITDMLQRMRELSIQAINDTNANDQRGYLDLEFQQLKKEIVRISDMTEWNGFKILDGSTGSPVGARPVYKATANPDFDTVFVSPTTFRDISGADAGEKQTITFANAATAAGTITVGGVDIDVSNGDSDSDIAANVAAALQASATFGAQSGRTVSVSGADVTISYGASEGNVDDISTSLGTVTGTTVAVATAADAITSANESFAANGKFSKSGALTINVSSGGVVTATFLGNDGTSTAMTGTLAASDGSITFAASGENSKVISDQLVYTFKDYSGSSVDITNRAANLAVKVEGSMPPLRSGDLIINGVVIGDSYVSDDKVSPPTNEVNFSNLSVADSVFASRTGLRVGVNAGTYSLESKVEAPISITTTPTFDITRARLPVGDFSTNQSQSVTMPRAVATSATDVKPLNAGDLVINGVAIRSTTLADDTVSSTVPASSSRQASALAISKAINDSTAQTGVTAKAYPARIEGTTTARGSATGLQSLFVNGIDVKIDFSVGSTAGERADEVVSKLNAQFGATGVKASKTTAGGVALEAPDGRNLSVWFNTGSGAPLVSADNFGLAIGSAAAPGVTSAASGLTATSAGSAAATVYGRVTLISNPPAPRPLPPGASAPSSPPPTPPIVVEPGVKGYTADSNFVALGFQELKFGGEVDASVSKMSPPRVGRLAFQVGAGANQLITIDLSDFGKNGPITGEITGDVDAATPTNSIATSQGATAVLANLDKVMDRVNATRANMGAVMNRLQYAMDNLSNVAVNQEASRSQIQDADYAAASTELAKTQIMQQAATAVLAQANMSQQSVLQLLKG